MAQVQTLGQIIAVQRSQGQMTQQALSPALAQKINQLKVSSGETIEEYMVAVNPSVQLEVCQDERDCYLGDYPTLGLLRTAYGKEAATMWLIPQLYNLSEYCGVKNKLEGTPLEECASIIANIYKHLKVSELMLFFYRFKAGKYGRFYGNVDPMIITSSLQLFCRERNDFWFKYDSEQRKKEMEESRKNAVTYDEYCKRRGIEPKKEIQALSSQGK